MQPLCAQSPALKIAYFSAEAHYQAENYHAAKEEFQHILDSFSQPENIPHLTGVLFRLAQIHAQQYTYANPQGAIQTHQPDVVQALHYTERALNIQPKNTDILYLKATLEYNHNQPLKAAQTLQQLCTLDPHSLTFHQFAAIALSQTIKGSIATQQAKELLRFCDSWETHLGLTEKVKQYRQLALDQQQIQAINNSKAQANRPSNTNPPPQTTLSAPNRYRKNLATLIEKNQFAEAHLWADSLEAISPVFSAHNLVNGFELAFKNHWQEAQAELANSDLETDPFIKLQYLRLNARITTQQQQTAKALNLWIELFEKEGLTPTDLPLAISVAEQAQSIQYLNRWKQMAQDLESHPNNK